MGEYAIALEDRPGYAVAHVSGDFVDNDHALKAWLAVSRALRERGQRRIMVLRSSGRTADQAGMAGIVHALADLGFAGVRGAMVLRCTPLPRFLEAIATQRGLELGVFDDEDSAQEFLLADGGPG